MVLGTFFCDLWVLCYSRQLGFNCFLFRFIFFFIYFFLNCTFVPYGYVVTKKRENLYHSLHENICFQINFIHFFSNVNSPVTIWKALEWWTVVWSSQKPTVFFKHLLTQIWQERINGMCGETEGNAQGGKSQGCRWENVGEERSLHLRFLLCMSLWDQGG